MSLNNLYRQSVINKVGSHQLVASRFFAAPSQQGSANQAIKQEDLLMGNLEERAKEIQDSIDKAKESIETKSAKGLKISDQIASQVQKDKFPMMQQFEVFMSKMDHLQRFERNRKKRNRNTINEMRSAYINSLKPLKDILFIYSKATIKGFDAELVCSTLDQIKRTMRARGNFELSYDDYTTREFEQSWRMQGFSEQFKDSLDPRVHFNHHYFGKTMQHMGEIGFKDIDIIQKSFDKLNQMFDERDAGELLIKDPVTFQEELYLRFRNFKPKYYVYGGFESHEDFHFHLTTLLDWEVQSQKKFEELSYIKNEESQKREVKDLKNDMKLLIEACSDIRDVQIDLQASIDNLRQQYFQLNETKDEFKFMSENKYIRLELLELQELLVKAGYLNPDEVDLQNSNMSQQTRMERASRIFYDYVQNYSPEMISPQYSNMIDALKRKENKQKKPSQSVDLLEYHDKISISSLTQAIAGLYKQATSYRREVNDRDYMNDFYRKHTTYFHPGQPGDVMERDNINSLQDQDVVSMEVDYLQAWDIFDKECYKLIPRINNLIETNKKDLEGQLSGFLGLSKAGIENPQLRNQMTNILLKRFSNEKKNIRTEHIINGLHGIGLQNQILDSQVKLGKMMLRELDQRFGRLPEQHLDFEQKIELLWAIGALGIEDTSNVASDLFVHLNLLNFDRIHNELTFSQFHILKDAITYITQASKIKDRQEIIENTSQAIGGLALNHHIYEKRYKESMANYDPFRTRVLASVTKGLTMAGLDHELVLENNLHSQTEMKSNFSDEQYPYKPDIKFGYQGNQVLLSVVPPSKSMRDIKQPNGVFMFRQRILQLLNEKPACSVGVTINSVIDYDLKTMDIKVRDNKDFAKSINQELAKIKNREMVKINFDRLADFGSVFTKELSVYLEDVQSVQDKKRMQALFNQMCKLFQFKNYTEKQFETESLKQGIIQIKFELMKLQLLFQTLPNHQKAQVNRLVDSSYNGDFNQLIEKSKENLLAVKVKNEDNTNLENIHLNWMGTRQEVELPQLKSQLNKPRQQRKKKSIFPEMINQKFMWVDNYFHYKDWETRQKSIYDSFNLMPLPRKEGEYKFFYDLTQRQRIVPQGIFPPPIGKRTLLENTSNEYIQSLDGKQSDELDEYEKEPHKMMVYKELERSKSLDRVNNEDMFKTNLLNMKQGLKSDYSDKKLLDTILLKLSLVDKLIQQHLSGLKSKDFQQESTQFVERDPREFRAFVKSTYLSKDQEDPFTHFFIKESAKVERIHYVHEDMNEKYKPVQDSVHTDHFQKEFNDKITSSIQDKIIDMMIENERENEDITSLSHQLKTEVKINYDLESLMKSEFIYDIDPEVTDAEITDKLFLARSRIRAEMKIIKSAIIYKIDQGIELTTNEKSYMQEWIRQIEKNGAMNLMNLRDSMMPKSYTKSSLASMLSPKDFVQLNQIPNVNLNQQNFGNYATSDIVLELAFFLDEELVNRVETEIFSKKLKTEWKLPKNFQLIETRNKEIGMVLNQLEELAWRSAGAFDHRDTDTLIKMLSIGRNMDYFDKQFYQNDIASLTQFLGKANFFDNKNKLLQEWSQRKEQEINQRVVLPHKMFKKPDQELFGEIEKSFKKAREALLPKLMQKNEKEKPVKYENISQSDLNKLSESLIARIPLFNGNYPAFLPQVVKAIMQHKNVSRNCASTLDTYCQMMNLDWRGDRSFEGRSKFMSTNPIYMHPYLESNFEQFKVNDVSPEQIVTQMRQACLPFVQDLVKEMKSKAKIQTKPSQATPKGKQNVNEQEKKTGNKLSN